MLGVVLVLFVALGAAVYSIGQSSFGHGFGVAVAIFNHSNGRVARANYYEGTGGTRMHVFLAIGVDPADARGIGCGLVRSELHAGGIDSLPWTVYAANGQPAALSEDGCP